MKPPQNPNEDPASPERDGSTCSASAPSADLLRDFFYNALALALVKQEVVYIEVAPAAPRTDSVPPYYQG